MEKMYRVAGPSSYTTGGFTVSLTDFKTVNKAVVVGENLDGNMVIQYSVSGNTLKIKVFTLSYSTASGITATEVSAGTDLSAYYFNIVAEGL